MNKLALCGLVLAVAACQSKSGGASSPGAPLANDDEKALYALGVTVANRSQMPQLKFTPAELEIVQRGIGDAAAGNKPEVPMETYGPKAQALVGARVAANNAAAAAAEKAKAGPYLDAAAKEAGAEKTASGLVYKEITPGTGESPKATDQVKVNYEGKLIDGTVFDSSYKRNKPITFSLNGVIPCWTEGVQKMKVGGTSQLVCPSSIAYGDRGRPPQIPGGATLTFKVELLSIEPPGAMPPGMMGHPMPGMPGGMPPGMGAHPPGMPLPGMGAHPMPPPATPQATPPAKK
jgi:FKBP-type peptidyl-prolyl cis-trans isomerase FkpA